MPAGDTIFQRLERAAEPDIAYLCDLLEVTHSGDRGVDKTELSRALRSAAGHSLVNLTRKPHDLAYRNILLTVADAMADGKVSGEPKLASVATDEGLEDLIEARFVRQKRKHLGLFPEQEVLSAAVAVAAMLKGAGFGIETAERAADWFRSKGQNLEPDEALRTAILFAAADSQLWLSSYGFSGPFWWLPKEMRLVVDLARSGGPALRKVVPGTLRLIQIRKRPSGVVAAGPLPRSTER